MSWPRKFKAYMLEHSTLSDATIEQHVSRVSMFARWLAPQRDNLGQVNRVKTYGYPAAASADHTRGYFQHLEKTHYVAGYRQHIKTALRYYYDFLLYEHAIKHAPDLAIPIRRNGRDINKTEYVLTDDQIQVLQEYFKPFPRNNVIFICLVDLGVRLHELLLMKAGDFDYGGNQVTIHSTKTEITSKYGGQRTMPLSPRLAKGMATYCAAQFLGDKDRLFHISDSQVWRIIKKAGAATGMPWLHPHLFRHYCITRFAQATGADNVSPIFRPKEASLMFGVSPEVIAERYDHPSTENIVSKALKSVYSGG